MVRKIKFGKIAIVIFLTILIWVWTDLDLDETHTVPRAVIRVAHSPELLVSFNGQPEALINNVRLKGPAKKISDVSKQIDNGELDLDFTFNPEREKMTATGSLTLNVLDFLKRSDKVKELGGLTIEDCEPDMIDVNIVELVSKPLDIEFVDENGVPVKVESFEPEKVDMYVPKDSRLKAQVRLTASNISQARLSGASVTPQVELAPGRIRRSTQIVEVKMSPEADSLVRYPISASLGYEFSKNLLGRYDVEIENYNEVVSFFILATSDAKNAYESRNFGITLEILDEDEKKTPDTLHRRDVVYNFPHEYLEKNEIRLEGEPEEARFKLKPISPAKSPPAGTN